MSELAALCFTISFLFAAGAGSGDPLIDWLKNNASAVGILAFLVVALMRGWLVTGREADGLRVERDRAIDLVYKQAELTSAALTAGATIAEQKGT